MLLGCCHCDRDDSSSSIPPSESTPSEPPVSQSIGSDSESSESASESLGSEQTLCEPCDGGVSALEYEIEWDLVDQGDPPGADPGTGCYAENQGPFYVTADDTKWIGFSDADDGCSDVYTGMSGAPDEICCYMQEYAVGIGCLSAADPAGGYCGPAPRVKLAFMQFPTFRRVVVYIYAAWCAAEPGEEAPLNSGYTLRYYKDYTDGEYIPCLTEIELDLYNGGKTFIGIFYGPGGNRQSTLGSTYPATMRIRPV
jgi:hypothetical protein